MAAVVIIVVGRSSRRCAERGSAKTDTEAYAPTAPAAARIGSAINASAISVSAAIHAAAESTAGVSAMKARRANAAEAADSSGRGI